MKTRHQEKKKKNEKKKQNKRNNEHLFKACCVQQQQQQKDTSTLTIIWQAFFLLFSFILSFRSFVRVFKNMGVYFSFLFQPYFSLSFFFFQKFFFSLKKRMCMRRHRCSYEALLCCYLLDNGVGGASSGFFAVTETVIHFHSIRLRLK